MLLRKVVLMLVLGLICSSTMAESVVSKKDADSIFSMTKSEWENTAPKYAAPNTTVRLQKANTGVRLASFDRSTGYGLSIQPFYYDTKSSPSNLLVSSFYPKGTLEVDFSEIKEKIEADAKKDLGEVYDVSADYMKLPNNMEVISLNITRKTNLK